MNIPMPKGFEMPENAKPGEPFEVVATIVAGEDGSFNITAIDGAALQEAAEEAAEEAPVMAGAPMEGEYVMPGENDTMDKLMSMKG